MKLAVYPKYKRSHVEWLGGVPQHWEVHKITRGFEMIASGTTPKSDSPEYYDGDVPWVTTSELRETTIHQTKQSVSREALRDYPTLRIYPIGTILFAMYGATIGRLGMLGIPATVNQACCAFSSPTKFDNRFVYYWLWMRRPILISLSSGGGQPNLSQDDLRQLRIPVPELDEQRAIADFLDRETARLDTLVEKKRELIEKLEEKRTALISRTVTRGLPAEAAAKAGLNPHPKLKPSGIEWLGDIPEHWEVKRLDFLASVKGRLGWKALTADEYVPEGFVFLSTPNIKGEEDIDFQNVNYISPYRYYESPEIMLRNRDVLLAKDGSTLGITNVVRQLPRPATVNSSIALIRPKPRLDSIFLFRWLRSSYLQGVIASMKDGQGVPHLFQADIRKFVVLLPPSEEQQAIADYLDCETAKIDKMIEKVKAAIEKLQKYRTALITAAVTGKIDVRNCDE